MAGLNWVGQVENWAAQRPDGIAVVAVDGTLTYRELNETANQIAWALLEQGVQPDAVVALLLNRGKDTLAAMLGVLKAGAAYLPIDLSLPLERQQYLLDDSQAAFLLTQQPLPHNLRAPKPLRIDLLPEGKGTNPNLPYDPERLAYVLYTSGSTGLPKGVLLPHGALDNYNQAIQERFPLATCDHFACVSTLAADLGNTVIFPALSLGATLHLIDREVVMDPVALHQYALQHPYDCLKIVPSHLKALLEHPDAAPILPRRVLVVGGESTSPALLARIRELAPELRIFNHYGPTETCVGVLTYALDGSETTVPLGKPLAQCSVYVLDEEQRPVDPGVSGELYIGGQQLAKGYLNRPELTMERFIPNPFGPGRLYRTGDRVQALPDGNIVFQGRVDHQVKVRGYRIELGEVEQALRNLPEVADAVVTTWTDHQDEVQLVAYLANPSGARLPDSAIRCALQAHLPAYMVPRFFIWLERIPLTANGKRDRAALPVPTGERTADETHQGGRDDLEAQLCRLWEEALGVRPVGIDDTFDQLGGTSLQAARLFRRIQEELGQVVPLSILIVAPTVRALAHRLRTGQPMMSTPCIVPIKPTGTRPPLFCVHGAAANVMDLVNLGENLPEEQPFYGLQSLGLDGSTEPLKTIEEIASHFLEEIIQLQPEGPYYLSGLSFGGMVAYQMACELRQRGEKVGMVALLDTNYPARDRTQPNHLGFFRFRVYPLIEFWELGILKFKRSGVKAFVTFVTNRWKESMMMRLPLAKRTDLAPILRDVWRTNITAERRYKPPVYPGKVDLFYATAWSLSEQLTKPDARLAWSTVAQGGLEVHIVPGDHGSMRYEPHVQVLAQKLSAAIERTLVGQTPPSTVP